MTTKLAIHDAALPDATRAAAAGQTRTPDQSWLRELCLLPAVVWYGVLFLGPLCFFMWFGFWTMDGYSPAADFSLKNYREIASNMLTGSRYALGIAQSLWVSIPAAVIATTCTYLVVISIVFGVPRDTRGLFFFLQSLRSGAAIC